MSDLPPPHPAVLAVDLDGTLLRSDMLHETFWSALAHDWRVMPLSLLHLGRGRAALKDMLARRAQVDIASLPYDAQVIDYIRDWRARGGRVALVTASDQSVAQAIAAHLDLFDEVHGSDGIRNLKGANKAAFLVERYGKGGFAYAGDHPADLKVWHDAGHAVVNSHSSALRRGAGAGGASVDVLDPPRMQWHALAKALRPHQWAKNALIFLPVAAAHHFAAAIWALALAAFVAFSLIASSVYLLNDLLDLSADRAHPRKRERPFASGRVPIALGLPATACLLAVGGAIALALGWRFFAVMLVYYIATTAYSLDLKRRPVIDVCVLAGLYTIRIVAGGVGTGTPLSGWLITFSLFLFFSLAAVKRQAELVDTARAGKLSLTGRGYHADDLDFVTQMGTASGYVSVLVMTLYVSSDAVRPLYPHPQALWAISPVLLYWVSRMIFTAHRGQMHDDPVVFAMKDKASLLCGLLVVIIAVAGALPWPA
jgi:4-hydroxybenzoate polyprenyltransferase/phosphoglycolate phosphatase-like HAD superfamily hydrolase